MKRAAYGLLLAMASCMGILTMLKLVYGGGVWPAAASRLCDVLYFAFFALGAGGSLWSLVVLSRTSLRRRVGVRLPVAILFLSSAMFVVRALDAAAVERLRNTPIRIEVRGPDAYVIDGAPLSRAGARRAIRTETQLHGLDRTVSLRASPDTAFSELEPVLNAFWRIRMGLRGAPDDFPVVLCPIRGDIDFAPVDFVKVRLNSTNCCRFCWDADGRRLDGVPIAPSAFAETFLPPTTNPWGYCVILYCATNATFGDICPRQSSKPWNFRRGNCPSLGTSPVACDSRRRDVRFRATTVHQKRTWPRLAASEGQPGFRRMFGFRRRSSTETEHGCSRRLRA